MHFNKLVVTWSECVFTPKLTILLIKPTESIQYHIAQNPAGKFELVTPEVLPGPLDASKFLVTRQVGVVPDDPVPHGVFEDVIKNTPLDVPNLTPVDWVADCLRLLHEHKFSVKQCSVEDLNEYFGKACKRTILGKASSWWN